jgi:predicted ArsR family transcriptional regulator
MVTGPQSYVTVLAPPMRRRVLQALVQSTRPLDAHAVAEQFGLHITTARFPLGQLEASGLVRRHTEAQKRRGRPRLLYGPIVPARDEGAREQLITVLAAALSTLDHGERLAVRAGALWADTFSVSVDHDPAGDLIDVLDRLGFDPEARADTIALRSCPLRDAAREHPKIVCSVHRGLIGQILERTGAGVYSQLLPFVEPDLCLVQLTSSTSAQEPGTDE